MRVKPSTCALLIALSTPFAVHAELPAAGMSMKAVEASLGQPLRKDPAVGNPPITRWEYKDAVVVFERSTVVHSMRIVRPSVGAAPAPAAPATSTTPAPVAAPASAPEQAPETTPAAPAPAASAPAASAPAASAPAETAAPAAAASPTSAEAEAMSRAAAEKSATDGATAPAEAPAPAPEGPTFDPETGRLIIK